MTKDMDTIQFENRREDNKEFVVGESVDCLKRNHNKIAMLSKIMQDRQDKNSKVNLMLSDDKEKEYKSLWDNLGVEVEVQRPI